MTQVNDTRFTNHKQSLTITVVLPSGEERVLKFAEVDNWDEYDPKLDLQGEELSLYEYHDFSEEVVIEYEVEENTHNLLYHTRLTNVIVDDVVIGKFLYVRECELAE